MYGTLFLSHTSFGVPSTTKKSRRENAVDTNSRTLYVYNIGYSSRNKVTFFSTSKNRFNHTYRGIVNSQLMYAAAYTGFFFAMIESGMSNAAGNEKKERYRDQNLVIWEDVNFGGLFLNMFLDHFWGQKKQERSLREIEWKNISFTCLSVCL